MILAIIVIALGTLLSVGLGQAVAQRVAIINYWAITVRGTQMVAELSCDGQVVGSQVLVGDELASGWQPYAFEADMSQCQETAVLQFTSVFPDRSLGWKIKAVEVWLDGQQLVYNGCFDGGLDGWVLDPAGWSYSKEGGTKNVIPGICGDNRSAAKHGPVEKMGAGTAGIPASIYQVLHIPATASPSPTGTIEPTASPSPTGTIEPTASPSPTGTIEPTGTPWCFYNHCFYIQTN